jgi:O-methyltransferase involved in polyketide biosynthesis
VRKVDYDYEKLGIPRSSAIYIAHRAKKLDEIAQRFTAQHPNAVGLDLGAGLDSRALRVAPPPTADWYDVDFPEVIAARRQQVPDRATPHGIGADLTDPTWLPARRRARRGCGRRADRVPLGRGNDFPGEPDH